MLSQLITETILGALTGYITNDTAIRSLFKPNGVIEQTRDDFAKEAGRLLEAQVLTPEVLRNQLMKPKVRTTIEQALDHFLRDHLPQVLGDLTLGDLPEHEVAVSKIHSALTQFLYTEKDTILQFMHQSFPVASLLNESQWEQFANQFGQVVLHALKEHAVAEQIWEAWQLEKGQYTLTDLELAPFCQCIVTNLAQSSTQWMHVLQQNYGEELKEAALNSIGQLQLDEVLLALDKQMETYTLGQYLNCDADDCAALLHTVLQSQQGKLFLTQTVSALIQALETVALPIREVLPADVLHGFVTPLQQEVPLILEEVLDWVWDNKQSVQRMLEETVDEIAAQTGGMKGALLQQLKESLLQEIMQSSDTYHMLLELLSQDGTSSQTADWLMQKLGTELSDNTIGQLVKKLNQNGTLQQMMVQFLYENIERYLTQSGTDGITNLLAWCPGSLHLAEHKAEVEHLLAVVLLKAADQLDLPTLILQNSDALYHTPITQFLQVDGAQFSQKLEQLIGVACSSAAALLTEVPEQKLYATLYDTIVWWFERHGTAQMEALCDDVQVSQLVQYFARGIDGKKNQLLDPLAEAGLAIMQGRLSVLAEAQIQSLSSEEMLALVEDFMGRELQPLNYLGAGMGAVAGATVGMALSTAVPMVSLATPMLTTGVLAGKAAVFGAVGYTTNCAAVKGLFWPYQPVAGIRTIQGVIPKQKERFAGSMGRLVDRYVINETILEEQIGLLEGQCQAQNAAETLATQNAMFDRLFAELALERRRLTAPLCDTLTAYGLAQNEQTWAAFGNQPLSFMKDILPHDEWSLEQCYERVLPMISQWLMMQLQQETPLDTLLDADDLWQWVSKTVSNLSLPDLSQMVHHFMASEQTLAQMAGDKEAELSQRIVSYLAGKLAQEETQKQIAMTIGAWLSGDKVSHWLKTYSSTWIADNLTMLFHWLEPLVLEFLQSRQESLTSAIEQAILSRMGFMAQMGYTMMRGREIVAAIVERLLYQKIPIFLSIKRRELETMLFHIWENRLAPTVQSYASVYLGENDRMIEHILHTVLAQPAVQHCAVQIASNAVQQVAHVPVKTWGRYIHVYDLLARPQMQLGYQWQTHHEDVIACWQQPVQRFCAEQLHQLTLAQLSRGYHDVISLEPLLVSPRMNDSMVLFCEQLETVIRETTVHQWFDWELFTKQLQMDLMHLLKQERFQEWLRYEAEHMVLVLAETPDQVLPVAMRVALIERILEAMFATAKADGVLLLQNMQLSHLAEEQLKQMDSAELEQVVRGFAGHYLVHIQNRGWLGAVFALPGMLFYLF